MDKGFKKERLIKRFNEVTSDNVSRKKKKNTYMAQSRQKLPNLISQRLYSSFNINDFKRFKCGIKSYFFSWPKERTMRLQQGKYVTYFQMNFKNRNNK